MMPVVTLRSVQWKLKSKLTLCASSVTGSDCALNNPGKQDSYRHQLFPQGEQLLSLQVHWK